MDRASLRNVFFPNGTSTGNSMDNASALMQQPVPTAAPGGESSDPSRALEIAGYPTLLQEYLLQQQQQQQQQQAAAVASATGFPTSLGLGASGFSQQNQWAGLTRASSNNALLGAGRGLTGPAFSEMEALQQQQQQQLDANQLIFQQLQAARGLPSGLPVGVWGNTSSGLKSNDIADRFAEQGILGPWSERSASLLGSMVATGPPGKGIKVKKGRKKQPKDKPKRPLSAYNLFFKEERARLLQKLDEKKKEQSPEGGQEGSSSPTPSKIGFENLAKIIGSKWQKLTPSEVQGYKEKAVIDMKRYKAEMETYLAKQQAAKEKEGEEVSQEIASVDNSEAKE